MERFTQVITTGGGFLMFCNPTMVGSGTFGVGGGVVAREGVVKD